jgi:hypothetical protein
MAFKTPIKGASQTKLKPLKRGNPGKDLRVNMTPEQLARVILRVKPRKARPV